MSCKNKLYNTGKGRQFCTQINRFSNKTVFFTSFFRFLRLFFRFLRLSYVLVELDVDARDYFFCFFGRVRLEFVYFVLVAADDEADRLGGANFA